jgi:16S rRNA (guanine1207-N2)-methyltransferase
MFPKVTRRPIRKQGTVYLATKTGPLKKIRDFDCEFAFRDQGRLIYAYSRPGVFSHRHIDPGARALINAMPLEAGMKVLDLGSGAGTVTLASAFRAENVMTHAVDSNARAIQALERGIAKNNAPGITAVLDAEGESPATDSFDLALANPPYFSNYAIADLFLDTAHRALKPKALVQVVTKTPNWFVERMPLWYADVQVDEGTGYWIVSGRKRAEEAVKQQVRKRSKQVDEDLW